MLKHRHSWRAMTLVACGLVVFAWRAAQPKTPVNAASAFVVPVFSGRPSENHQGAPEVSGAPEISVDQRLSETGDDRGSMASEPNRGAAPPASLSLAETLIGSWRDDFYGKRIFEFRPDGTATMTIELDQVGQLLYGPKLTFFIEWTVKDDLLTMRMTGGEPKQTTTTVAKLFGETSEQRVERFTADELTLRSLDSQKLYIHRRVVPAE